MNSQLIERITMDSQICHGKKELFYLFEKNMPTIERALEKTNMAS